MTATEKEPEQGHDFVIEYMTLTPQQFWGGGGHSDDGYFTELVNAVHFARRKDAEAVLSGLLWRPNPQRWLVVEVPHA